MKTYADQKRREEQFNPGDWVYLKIQPHRQKTITQKALYKLGCRFYGPYQVVSKVGEVAYKLDLPAEAHIHPVIHVSQLKRSVGDTSLIMTQLPSMDMDGNIMLRPLKALEYRRIKRGSRFRWEVLLQWELLPSEEATWEDLAAMKHQFPHLVLEDKDKLQEGGNDENQGRQLKNAYNRARRAMIKETRSTANMQSLHEDITGHMHEDRTGVMHEEEVSSKMIGT